MVMTADNYLKLTTDKGGLHKGEAKVKEHADEIEIYSWSMGEEQQVSRDSWCWKHKAVGRVNFHDFSFSTPVNRASAGILLACATGDPVTEAILSCRKAGGSQGDYLIWTLIDGMITSYTVKGDPDNMPSETFTVAFSEIKWEYKMQKPDGKLVAGGAMEFNLRSVSTG
jgi:type VI secretion system secreted protein Hcp